LQNIRACRKAQVTMIEVGVVHKLTRSGFAVVRFDRKMACENCNMCFKPKEENYVELKVKNDLGAKEGDRVSVQMGERAVLTASFWVYVVPLVLVGIVILSTYKLPSEWISIGASLGTLVVSLAGLTLVDRIYRKKKGFFPMMTRIITEESEKGQNTQTTENTIAREEKNQ